jgi:phosphomannomutase
MKVVFNSGNGSAGAVIEQLVDRLPIEPIYVHLEPNGEFPNGVPNPLLIENRTSTAQAVVDSGADFGVAWDGDFDRCFFFDKEGQFIEGYYVVGLLAASLLNVNPGEKIIHDPRLTWNTIDIVQQKGGIPIQSKTGHAFIKEIMRLEDAVYGGEMSAHHYFRQFNYCDSGMIPWLLVAQLLADSNQSLAGMVKERIAMFPCSGEVNFRVSDIPTTIQRVMEHYSVFQPSCDHTDGVSMDFSNWRLNIRASNTEPLLRVNIESRGSVDLVQEKLTEVSSLINQG